MNTQNIGNYIREKRVSKGWTQEKLAELVDVSTKTIGTWERGEFSYIKNDNLEKLSDVLHVSFSEIYLGKDLTGLDEETKMLLDQDVKNINERLDDVRTITINVEDRGLLSMEMGVYAFGISIIALATAWWAASSHTAVTSFICFVLALFGVGFAIFGKRVITKLAKRVQKGRSRTSK